MSDSIPFEIQVEIMKKLPVKSLIRFRGVSKPWKSLIESSGFIADHHTQPRQHHRLLVSYDDYSQFSLKKHLCIVDDDDDDGFPKHKFPLSVPMSVYQTRRPSIIGSSHGLMCFYNSDNKTVILWNPCVRKSVDIMVPNNVLLDLPYHTVVGFGVCPGTCDPKLVMVTNIRDLDYEREPWQVKVFTLSSRAWKTPSCTNLPRKSIWMKLDQVVIDGIIYFLACDRDRRSDMIISFDLTSEEFGEIYVPNRSALKSYEGLSISKRGESLVVLGYYFKCKQVCDVWMMEHGIPKSFTKLYNVEVPDNLAYVSGLGFRKNGELLVEMRCHDNKSSALGIFEHSLGRINDLGLYGKYCSFYVSSYSETLFLLNQQDSIIY